MMILLMKIHLVVISLFEVLLVIVTSKADLGGDPDIGEGRSSTRWRGPLRDVERPLGGRAGLKQVAPGLKSGPGPGAGWN